VATTFDKFQSEWFPDEPLIRFRTGYVIARHHPQSLEAEVRRRKMTLYLRESTTKDLTILRRVGEPIAHDIKVRIESIDAAKTLVASQLERLSNQTERFLRTAPFGDWTCFQVAQAVAYTNWQEEGMLLCKGGAPGVFITDKVGRTGSPMQRINKLLIGISTPDDLVPASVHIPLPQSAREMIVVEAIREELNLR